MMLKVILRSLSSAAKIVPSCFFFTYYFDVAIICFFLYRQYINRQYIKYFNILMCMVNQNIWFTFLE